MEIPGHIECDVCKQPKGETNHWLECVTLPPTADAPGLEGIAFAPFGTPVRDPKCKVEHICGQTCAHKRFSQWLDALAAVERKIA